MKKLLVAGIAAAAFCGAPALAADLPTKAPVYKATPALAPTMNWTGCYIGGNVGYLWGSKDTDYISFTPPGSVTTLVNDHEGHTSPRGWAYGGQLGCDYQFNNNWIVGIRGMWDGANATGTSTFKTDPGLNFNNYKISQFATLVATFGVLLNPTFELYALGGFAWVRDQLNFTDNTSVFATGNQTRSGFDVGIGMKWMFAPHWDLFVEYDYMSFGTKHMTLSGIVAPELGFSYDVTVAQHVDKILVGINYRFGDMGKAPVVAKY